MIATLAVSALFGVGILLLIRALVPPRRDLAVALGRWDAGRERMVKRAAASDSRTGRLGAWTFERFARRGINFSRIQPDLEITSTRADEFIGKTVLLAVASLVVPPAIGPIIGMPIELIAIMSCAVTVVVVVGRISELRKSATACRKDLVTALATYLGLISLSLSGHLRLEAAMVDSMRLGSGWAYQLIQRTVERAGRVGATPWEELGALGERVGLSELVDLGTALAMVGESGSKVRSTLEARAATMRARQLDEVKVQAQMRNEQMVLAQILMVFGFIIFLGFAGLSIVVGANPGR